MQKCQKFFRISDTFALSTTRSFPNLLTLRLLFSLYVYSYQSAFILLSLRLLASAT